jgi:alkaline phosphatase
MKLFLFLLSCFFYTCFVQAQPSSYSVGNAHSHNDYENPIPFFTAYEAGFGSIEADIFLSDGQLIVAHDSVELLKRRTLQSLYLDPLVKAVRAHHGHVYEDSTRTLQMLIDIKSDSIRTLDKLMDELKSIPLLAANPSIHWVITGNRPDPALFSFYPAFIRFDGELARVYSGPALSKIAMMSGDFGDYSAWKGEGPMPAATVAVLKATIVQSHALHKPIRFWDAPDNINAWKTLMGLQVDYINTDHIRELALFLNTSQDH